MILLWTVGLIGGLAIAAAASRRAVTAALAASEASSISPALIGATVLALGTDLPEIASSVVAAMSGHGDVIVGDAAGSALTQVTLVLGLLCLAGRPIATDRTVVVSTGAMATGALLIAALMLRNGSLSRWQGLVLCIGWVVALVVVKARSPGPTEPRLPITTRRAGHHSAVALGWLALVGIAATVMVESFVHLSDRIGVPELVASAVVLSLGTSLPELVVDWTALRQSASALAVGDLFGSTLLDATLALGIGPALRAVEVSATSSTVAVIAALAVVAATAIAGSKPTHDHHSAPLLFAVYAASIAAILVTIG